MRRRTVMEPDDATTRENRRRWWFGALASVGGSVVGLLTSLYPAELREVLAAAVGAITANGLLVGVTALLASASAVLFYELPARRGRERITTGRIRIGTDALVGEVDPAEPLVGRSLGYLEARRPTEDLIVLLHGLGLDAEDFHPYLATSSFHCVAVSQYGFSRADRADEQYRPVSLRTQVHLVGYALMKLREAYPRKRMSVVGFSVGADLLLLLSEFEPETVRRLRLRRALLLDPNVDNSTTVFSSRIARTKRDDGRTLRELTQLLGSADNQAEFRYLCEYLAKITSKDLARIRLLAQELVARFQHDSPEPFLNTLGRLASDCGQVRTVFSLNHEPVFYEVVKAAEARGMDVTDLECARADHFDLIRPDFLDEQLRRSQPGRSR